MKAVLAALLGVALVASAMSDYEQWVSFKNKFGTNHKMGEEAYRFEVFKNNMRAAEKMQAKSKTASYGVTQFMALTPDEFHARFANLNATAFTAGLKNLPKASIKLVGDNIVDWKAKGMVSAVEDQGQCGSCWAFSATAAMESCWLMAGNSEVHASEQQVVDCCTYGGSEGCNGGFPAKAVEWLADQDMATLSSYPYKAKDGSCKKITDVAIPKGTCKFVSVSQGETATATALKKAPLSIALDATPLQYYQNGIIDVADCSKYQSIDHAVFLVANDGAAYTVKNSWGTSWGESGFFRMPVNQNCLNFATMSSMAVPAN